MINETVSLLISQSDLKKRVTELAGEISKDFRGKSIKMVCVLKGAVFFLVDLARELQGEVSIDFMSISSYEDSSISSGVVKIIMDLTNPIRGQDVLLIEDIVDTGRTLSYVVNHLKAKEPASLKVCSLLDKPERREVDDVIPNYIGFTIPDEFVVGYGLDYDQKYRNLPYIGILKMI